MYSVYNVTVNKHSQLLCSVFYAGASLITVVGQRFAHFATFWPLRSVALFVAVNYCAALTRVEAAQKRFEVGKQKRVQGTDS